MQILLAVVGVNARGEPQREQRRIDGEQFDIGRSSSCRILLPDPRVAQLHARLSQSASGAVIEALSGTVRVNGRAVATARLAVGDRVEIGPYLVQVETPPQGAALALTATLSSVLTSAGKRALRRTLERLTRVSKRRLSYFAFLCTLLVALVVPVLPDLRPGFALPMTEQARRSSDTMLAAASGYFLQAWNPGPLSRSHEAFGTDCHACHQSPFVAVQDMACIACHKRIHEHAPPAQMTGARAVSFVTMRCAQCHRDHQGASMLPHAQSLCVGCHRDIRGIAPQAQSQNVIDFHDAHPQFRVSMIDPDRPDNIVLARLAGPDSPAPVERSGLKFNHALHLEAGGIRDPHGKRDPAGMRDAEGRRTVLECASCHEPGDSGRLMKPVTMERHCRRCHSLAFEPGARDRQVPHGPEQDIVVMLREFYARLVLGDVPAEVTPPPDLPRMRPGAVLTHEQRRRALEIADRKAQRVLRELFETRDVCSTCHTVQHKEGGGWRVAPVRLTREWMPRSLFSHAAHAAQTCETCHDVRGSKKASDIAIPGIAVCRECHVGAQPVTGRVTSDCGLCHRFHAGRDYWHGARQALLLPRGSR